MRIYVIEYDGKISKEGYNSIDKAISHLEKQEYYVPNKNLASAPGWVYVSKYCGQIAKIHEIKIK